MECKIGEIFEYNGDWYQCLKSVSCGECDFSKSICIDNPSIKCCADDRNDNCSVVFKKLEKVGEPVVRAKRPKSANNFGWFPYAEFQKYKVSFPVILPKEPFTHLDEDKGIVYIEIKENKEDMEDNRTINQHFAECEQTINEVVRKCYTENKSTQVKDTEENKTIFPKEDNALTRTVYAYVNGKISDKELIRSIKEMSDEYTYNKNNLKPFSLELAKQGKPVCTRDGRKARIICFDRNGRMPIVALITNAGREDTYYYFNDGKGNNNERDYNLMMLPEKKEGWVNIYKSDNGTYYTGAIFYEKNDALVNTTEIEITTGISRDCIDTVKISWEE